MGLIGSFVANPVKVTVGVLLLLLFGSIALTRMPMQLTPEVATPTITIETRWSGASPQEVEREIIQEQEEQLKSVEGVTKMTAESQDSQAKITLEFGVGTDMREAVVKVNARLNQVPEYPEEADQPVLSTANSADTPIAWFILRPRVATDEEIEAFLEKEPALRKALAPALRAENTGLRHNRLLAAAKEHPGIQALLPPEVDMQKQLRFAEDHIEARFERVNGVSNSNVLGGREDEMRVVLDPYLLSIHGVTVDEIRQALRRQNVDTSAGDFWEGKRRYVVRTLNKFKSKAEVESVLLRNDASGPVYVRDVAKVEHGYKKTGSMVAAFGLTVLAVNCIRESGANVIEVMNGLYEANAELNRGVLKERGLMLEQVYDETEYIHSAVGLVRQNILFGGLLTVIVLLVFLRSPRSTFVIALAIPTSIIGTFLILGLLGRSLNVISLAGLAFAVGMLVDNAVVVLENIYRHYQEGARRRDAAIRGAKEVWGAVVASTLTTLAVFLPILFIEEEAGQLFRDIALAISASVGLSLLLSITLIPTASARVLPKSRRDQEGAVARAWRAILHPLYVAARGFVSAIIAFHRWLSRGVARQLALIAVLVAGAIFGTMALFPKVEYLPTGNRNLAIGFLLPPPGYNLDELIEMGETVEARLQPYWDVDADDPKRHELDYPAIKHFFFVARGRQVFLGLRAMDETRAKELVPLIRKAVGGLPGVFAFAQQTSLFGRGLSAGRTIDVEISGPRLPELVGIGGRVFGQAMGMIPGAQVRPQPSLDLSNPEVHVTLRRERAAELAVDASQLGYLVNSLVDGAYAGDYYLDGERIDLTLVGADGLVDRMQDLEGMPIATPSGDYVPLGAIARVDPGSGPEQINRRERERTITIQVNPPREYPIEEALDNIESQIVDPLLAIPDRAYQIRLSGTADKLTATWQALSLNIILAIVITYLMLAALFESWLYPFIIILSVPLGAVGGFLGLWLLNTAGVFQPLDVLTMIGFVILIGTVVNNAILIVHQSLVHVREEGMPADEAVAESVRNRVRPIFMTMTTTVCGLAPLVLFPGAGSELYRGLGSILIGGLVVSTVFTIFLVPTLLRLVFRLKAFAARMLGLDESEESTLPAPEGSNAG